MSEQQTFDPETGKDSGPSSGKARYIFALLPLFIFAAMAILFLSRIGQDETSLPSVLIGKAAPQTNLPALEGVDQSGPVTNQDFVGKTTIVNVWASWCVPCRQEHPIIMELSKNPNVQIIGISYKDSPEKALRFITELGNPFDKIGVDERGRQTIDWGVYGVPETYIIDKNGIITHKHVGPLTEEKLNDSFMAELKKAMATELVNK